MNDEKVTDSKKNSKKSNPDDDEVGQLLEKWGVADLKETFASKSKLM